MRVWLYRLCWLSMSLGCVILLSGCGDSGVDEQPLPSLAASVTPLPASETPSPSAPPSVTSVVATATRQATASPAPPTPTAMATVPLPVLPSATNTSKPTRTPSAAPTLIQGQVISDVGAYIRRGPGTDYEIVGELLFGETFSVVAYSSNDAGDLWYLVFLEDGSQAWISSFVAELLQSDVSQISLSITQPPTFAPTSEESEIVAEVASPTAPPVILASPTLPQGTNAIVSGRLGVNLRSGASYGYSILRVLDRETPLVIIGRNVGGTWYEVVTFDTSETGWVNANYVDALVSVQNFSITWFGPAAIAGVECGMNIHPYNGEGWRNTLNPDLNRSQWVRFPFTSSPRYFESLAAAFAFFDPVIDTYTSLGVKVLLVINHETYGEALNWDWGLMDTAQWRAYTNEFVAVLTQIVQRYGNRVAGYEIWNEGDVELGNPAAVPISPADYAPMLQQSARVIRQYAPQSRIIVGGLLDASGQYIQGVQQALGGSLPVDAIAIHPYGRGAPDDNTVFSSFGNLTNVIEAYQRVAPNIPLWITEIGAVGDNSPSRWAEAGRYMEKLFRYVQTTHYDTVDTIMWYAWSDAMHPEVRTNGLVTDQQVPKEPLYDLFFNLCS